MSIRVDLTPSELEAVREGEQYRKNGAPGYTLDQVEAALDEHDARFRRQAREWFARA